MGRTKQPKAQQYACPACFRPVAEKDCYCASCITSGGAKLHLAMINPPARKPAKRQPAKREQRPKRVGTRETPRGVGNRNAPGAGAHQQSPARDAAMRLMETPGVEQVVHTYQHERRVKAALWYLRNRCDLPPGFRFWRDGVSVVGVYEQIDERRP